MPTFLDSDRTLALRVARKPWRCYVQRRPEVHHRGTCPKSDGVIHVGEVHIEYLGDARPFASGIRYCEECGRREFATWIAAKARGMEEAARREAAASATRDETAKAEADLAVRRAARKAEAHAARKAGRAVPVAEGSLVVRVPESIAMLFQMDDTSILALYGATHRASTRSYVEFAMTHDGAAMLLRDVKLAASGHFDGGSDQQNAGAVRSAESFAPKLAALLAAEVAA